MLNFSYNRYGSLPAIITMSSCFVAILGYSLMNNEYLIYGTKICIRYIFVPLFALNLIIVLCMIMLSICIFTREMGPYSEWLGIVPLFSSIITITNSFKMIGLTRDQKKLHVSCKFKLIIIILVPATTVIIYFIFNAYSMSKYLNDLQSNNPNTRSYAAQMLRRYKNTRVIEALIKAGEDEDYEVRAFSIKSLIYIGNKYSLPYIMKHSEDEVAIVRLVVAKAIGEMGTSKELEVLLKLADDDSSDVRQSAIYSIGLVGDKQLVPLIKKKLRDNDYIISKIITQIVLAKLGEIEYFEEVINRLRNDDSAQLKYDLYQLKRMSAFNTKNNKVWWQDFWKKNKKNVIWKQEDHKWYIKE